MSHPKQHIIDLAEICRMKGVKRAVISPGSRSAPLVEAFCETLGEGCTSIVDERSAAYFALGLALYSQEPVVLICTSGTAVLNYAPALAEAYYQQVPLIAITADRPHERIDQQDNQALRQYRIYQNFVKGNYELPQAVNSPDDLLYAHRMVHEAVNLCLSPAMGPVHINVPLAEPLYEELPPPSGNIRLIQQSNLKTSITLPEEMADEWKKAARIMIIHGQDIPGNKAAQALQQLSEDRRVVVIAENLSNITGKRILSGSNLALSTNRSDNPAYPDLILHSGGQVVSKALSSYLRKAPELKYWRIGNDRTIIDTYRHVTRVVPYAAAGVYQTLMAIDGDKASWDYSEQWLAAEQKARALTEKITDRSAFCDARLFRFALNHIPSGSVVSLGNSSIIRYSQLFQPVPDHQYFSNRGVSGIDGCLSTASGIASASGKLTVAITGDLSFLYDSNALWNRELPPNLKILVINNRGGGIFHILKGPSEHSGFKKFIEAHHPVNISNLAKAYGLDYFYVGDEESLADQWPAFIEGRSHAVILEVSTDAATSAAVFREFMSTQVESKS